MRLLKRQLTAIESYIFFERQKRIQYQRAKCRRIVNHSSTIIIEVDERTKTKCKHNEHTQKKNKITVKQQLWKIFEIYSNWHTLRLKCHITHLNAIYQRNICLHMFKFLKRQFELSPTESHKKDTLTYRWHFFKEIMNIVNVHRQCFLVCWSWKLKIQILCDVIHFECIYKVQHSQWFIIKETGIVFIACISISQAIHQRIFGAFG